MSQFVTVLILEDLFTEVYNVLFYLEITIQNIEEGRYIRLILLKVPENIVNGRCSVQNSPRGNGGGRTGGGSNLVRVTNIESGSISISCGGRGIRAGAGRNRVGGT